MSEETHGLIIGRPTGGAIGDIEAGTGGKPSRSGYARDKYPDRLEGPELAGLATPIADTHGRQVGRVPSAKRKTGHYAAVTASEADSLLSARIAGTKPRIANGLDGPGQMKGQITVEDDPRMEVGDQPELPSQPSAIGNTVPLQRAQSMVVGNVVPLATPVLEQTMTRLAQVLERLDSPREYTPSVPKVDAGGYLQVRSSVQFGMANGTFTVPAIDVKAGGAGLVILLPYGGTQATFVPAPREKFNLRFGNGSWKCYYPGTVFEFPELGVMMLVVLQVEDEPKSSDQPAG